ncbi:CEBPZ-like protein [Mya arenaria]|uniref:CEBPZ-like protein n=1 Tax=Mya arenaria TaxID=6604 RepID=A0ABY7FAH0_MYAAR|nr:CEBPZ-like protein [Mya arenaria]
MAAKTKRKETKTRVEDNKLCLDSIAELGGTKEDLELLEDVPDSGSDSGAESLEDDIDAEPIKKEEIRSFLKQLDIYKYRPGKSQESETDAEEKKEKVNLVSPAADQGQDDGDKQEPGAKKKEKKEKNKYRVQHEEVSSTSKDPGEEYRTHMKAYVKRKYLLVKPGEYFDTQVPIDGVEQVKFSDNMIGQMEEFAAKLLNDEIAVYNKQRENSKRSDVQWMKTVLMSGTLADKIAALTVLLQETPLHNIGHLDTLFTMARKKNRRENLQAVETLKELFLTDLIPGDRKLKTFAQRDLAGLGTLTGWNKEAMDKRLLMWYFESQLKQKYAHFVTILETLAQDILLPTKQKAVSVIYNLLVEKPEEEKKLLTTLINKVGDPHYKMASSVSHLLTKLVEAHPNMKVVVVKEVERLVFRPNIADRAQYYSVCFLNQLRLSTFEKDLAAKLIGIYFSFFKGFVKKGEVDSKMMSALLTGVNRAFPYAKLEERVLSEQLDHLYKIVHIVNFNTSLQALMLLYQVMDTSQNISERYYSALYRKLSDPAIKTSSKQAAFLNLLFKSIKKDECERRVKAFIKRLLQICAYQQPNFTCGAMLLLSEVLKVKPGLLSLTHAEVDSDDEEHFVDQPEGTDEQQASVDHDDQTSGDNDKPTINTGSKTKVSSWVHRANLNHKTEKTDYDPYHRNPMYCHAENECIWELEGLTCHYHPTVALFAKQLLQGDYIDYSGDPLQDFTIIRFLDRFVYKNPKKKQQIEEKVSNLARGKSKLRGIKNMVVTSEQFAKLEERKVPVDDVYLHRYFREKSAREKKGKAEDDSDTESITDAEFDNFLEELENLSGSDDNADFADADEYADDLEQDEDEDEGLEDEDFEGDGEDLAEEGKDFDGEDEFKDIMPSKAPKRKAGKDLHKSSSKKQRNTTSDSDDILAAAEQFGDMLDEAAGSKFNTTGSHALANKDKADAKQLKWEMDRDRWLRGPSDKHRFNKKRGGQKSSRGGQKFNRGKPNGKSKNALFVNKV